MCYWRVDGLWLKFENFLGLGRVAGDVMKLSESSASRSLVDVIEIILWDLLKVLIATRKTALLMRTKSYLNTQLREMLSEPRLY